ncbi:MAG: sterol desaturase family protein [Alphaproteobacteria bacterium]
MSDTIPANPKSITGHEHHPIKYALSWVLWPALFIICMGITAYGFSIDQTILYFNAAYIFLILSLFLLEKYMPHERQWLNPDGQNIASILHTLSSKGTVQGIFVFGGTLGLLGLLEDPTHGIWPNAWPLWAQVTLAIITAEFGLYWAHRAGHETALIWRFHAVHHSVTKLWFLNTGRFHFIDSVISIILAMGILAALGAPIDVMKWVSAITAFIGMLTHCNVEMRFGWLSYIFNTPGLHRWHHSKDLKEGNRNYGENVMIWDILFRTYYDADYRPPADIGMKDYMPKRFSRQIIWPFLSIKTKQRLEPDYEPLPFIKEEK